MIIIKFIKEGLSINGVLQNKYICLLQTLTQYVLYRS
jgi:hypothetical protein